MSPRPDIGCSPARVLIVDDERHNRQLLEVMLAPEGYLLQSAVSGEQALALVAEKAPDLILLDVMMPGIDGYEVASRIKADPATKHIPIIMVTALEDGEARMIGLNSGAEEFLAKPVNRAELAARVRNLLRLKAYGEYFDNYSRMLEDEVAARTADLAERTRQAAALALLSERLSLATEVAQVGVWDWDLASHSLAWNDTMFEIHGTPRVDPVLYADWAALVRPGDLAIVEAEFRRAMAGKGQVSTEYGMTRPDGSPRTISIAGRVILDAEARIVRVIGVSLDITERRRVEAAAEHLREEKLKFKDDFLSHVSHELRSPLTAIKQFTNILAGGLAGELNPEQLQYQNIVLKNILQLQSMIDDLLEVTRLETGKLAIEPERTDAAATVADTFETLRETARLKDITLSSELAQDLPSAYADPTRLRQILIILLDNAIKFTPRGGAVTLRACCADDAGEQLRFEVSDTGGGISPEIDEQIFERLYQESEHTDGSRNGLGLGLHICKELVTRQGGSIWIDRQRQEGCTFAFTLPACSLGNVLAPHFKDGRWPAESLGLVIVELRNTRASHSQASKDERGREVRSLIQGCLAPDRQVLLPGLDSDAQAERWFVAVFGDDQGAGELADRLRQHFQSLPHLNGGRSLSVYFEMLHPCSALAGSSAQAIVLRMAGQIELSLRPHLIQGAA